MSIFISPLYGFIVNSLKKFCSSSGKLQGEFALRGPKIELFHFSKNIAFVNDFDSNISAEIIISFIFSYLLSFHVLSCSLISFNFFFSAIHTIVLNLNL